MTFESVGVVCIGHACHQYLDIMKACVWMRSSRKTECRDRKAEGRGEPHKVLPRGTLGSKEQKSTEGGSREMRWQV